MSQSNVKIVCMSYLIGVHFLWLDAIISLNVCGRGLVLAQINVQALLAFHGNPYLLGKVDGDWAGSEK